MEDQQKPNNKDFGNIIPLSWKERLEPPKEGFPDRINKRNEDRKPEDRVPAGDRIPAGKEPDPEEDLEQNIRKKVRARVRQKRRQARRKRLIRLGIIAAAAVLCLLIFVVLFRCKTIQYSGNEYYTEEQLNKRIVTRKLDKNTLFLYWKLKSMKNNSIPFVENIEVEMEDSHTLKVQIYEKTVIGCIHYMSQYIFFDKDGIVVETSSKPKADVPVISGLQMKSFSLFQTMQIEDPDLYGKVLGLSQLIQKYDLSIDRIEFDPNENVTLYSEKIEIQLGKRDVYDEQLAELKNLLPAAKGLSGILNMKDYKPGQGRIILQEKDEE